jgi:ribonuclease HI
MTVSIYCDGSAKDNGKENNAGGFGVCALVLDKSLSSGFRIDYTLGVPTIGKTNNQNELTALLKALELTQTKYKNDKCVIYSDSAYCVNIFNEWIQGWASHGWMRYGDKPVENLELIKQLWEYWKIEWNNFQVKKIPGHAGIIGNELADALATSNQAKLEEIFSKNDDLYRMANLVDRL